MIKITGLTKTQRDTIRYWSVGLDEKGYEKLSDAVKLSKTTATFVDQMTAESYIQEGLGHLTPMFQAVQDGRNGMASVDLHKEAGSLKSELSVCKKILEAIGEDKTNLNDSDIRVINRISDQSVMEIAHNDPLEWT